MSDYSSYMNELHCYMNDMHYPNNNLHYHSNPHSYYKNHYSNPHWHYSHKKFEHIGCSPIKSKYYCLQPKKTHFFLGYVGSYPKVVIINKIH